MFYKIEKNNIIFLVQNTHNEPINIFFDKWYFIIDFLHDNPKYNLSDVEKLSNIFINVKYYQCKYQFALYKKIEKYL
jgi:hypothetical protein